MLVAARAHHAKRRRALHGLSLTLARHPEFVTTARGVVDALRAHDRVARLTAVFSFVAHTVDASDGRAGGVAVLIGILGTDQARLVVLAAMLQALGERAQIDYARELAFVRVEIDDADVARLPPHAALLRRRGRYFLPLAVRSARSPVGFLPFTARRGVLERRQG